MSVELKGSFITLSAPIRNQSLEQQTDINTLVWRLLVTTGYLISFQSLRGISKGLQTDQTNKASNDSDSSLALHERELRERRGQTL